MITVSDDTTLTYPPAEMSRSAKYAIETMKVALAGEITTYLGTVMQAAAMKMVEAIHASELPKFATLAELEEMMKGITERMQR